MVVAAPLCVPAVPPAIVVVSPALPHVHGAGSRGTGLDDAAREPRATDDERHRHHEGPDQLAHGASFEGAEPRLARAPLERSTHARATGYIGISPTHELAPGA